LTFESYLTQTSNQSFFYSTNSRLTTRQARLLHELYTNPYLPKYQLAKRLKTTDRIVTKELDELNRDFSLHMRSVIDPHKFKLICRVINFCTKSLRHSDRLQAFLKNQSKFLRNWIFDQDNRRGLIVYQYPNQTSGHHLFNNRVQWLFDEFFESYNVAQISGIHYFFSLISYDPTTRACSLDVDIVGAMLQSVKKHYKTIPSPEGMFFGQPIVFKKVDYLLSHIAYGIGPERSIDYKLSLLKRFGFDLSKKTIWKRIQRLRQAHAAAPFVQMRIPGFDEHVKMLIHCNPDSREIVNVLPSVLPYAVILTTSYGCELSFQRPMRCTAITGQLIRAMHREEGVEDIELIRFQSSYVPSNQLDVVDLWDDQQQNWILEEGDI